MITDYDVLGAVQCRTLERKSMEIFLWYFYDYTVECLLTGGPNHGSLNTSDRPRYTFRSGMGFVFTLDQKKYRSVACK